MAKKRKLTLGRLIKELTALKSKGLSDSIQVCVDKTTLFDGNGTFNACNLNDVEHTYVNIVDGDGFTIENKNGSERIRSTILLKGLYSE